MGQLQTRGNACRNMPIGGAKNQHEAVSQGNASGGNTEFIGPQIPLGQFRRKTRRIRLNGIDGEMYQGYFSHRSQLHAMFPVQRKLHRAHRFLRKISASANGLQSSGTGLIADGQREQKLVREQRDFVCSETKNSSVNGFVGLQVIEKSPGGDAAIDAKAWAIGDAAVADQEDAAVVVLDVGLRRLGRLGFFLRLGSGGESQQ
jgi:hypothetical protein